VSRSERLPAPECQSGTYFPPRTDSEDCYSARRQSR